MHRGLSTVRLLAFAQMPIPIDRLVRSRRKTIALIVRPDGSLKK